MNAPTVIYHSADFDGIFCREIARKFLPRDTHFIGWNYGDAPMEIPSTELYVMDLPLDRIFGFDYSQVGNAHGPQHPPGLVWIDHHRTSIDSHPQDIPGLRIDGVAACRLAWQWFASAEEDLQDHRYLGWPPKQDFLDRKVQEPLAVCLAGEYDVAGPNANEEALNFQFGLRSTEIAGDEEQLLTIGAFGDQLVREIAERGVAVRAYLDRADLLNVRSAFTVQLDGLRFLALNAYRGNSKAMQEAAKAEHDAVMAFAWRGKGWTVSMYGIPGKPIDLSLIAKKHGGGGHPAACGFECKQLPFAL